uniref:Uncharacterized protein n=1 Tax=Ailuropoda melanoleuca TaxID=9646 RepID=A0A7N5K502_AILME
QLVSGSSCRDSGSRLHSSDLSPGEQESKPQFEMKRKLEYNEGLSIKLAGQIISKDLHEEEEDAGMSETTAEESVPSGVEELKYVGNVLFIELADM